MTNEGAVYELAQGELLPESTKYADRERKRSDTPY